MEISKLAEKIFKENTISLDLAKSNLYKKIRFSHHFRNLLSVLGYKYFVENKTSITISEISSCMNASRPFIYDMVSFLVKYNILKKVRIPNSVEKKYVVLETKILEECLVFINDETEKNNRKV